MSGFLVLVLSLAVGSAQTIEAVILSTLDLQRASLDDNHVVAGGLARTNERKNAEGQHANGRQGSDE